MRYILPLVLSLERRILVEWNQRWQPICNEGSDLAYFVGTIAKNPMLCSLSYTAWRRVPKEEKKGLLEIVETVNGVEPSRAHVYVDTHKDRKTRLAPIEEKSKQAVDMINEKLSQLPGVKEVTNRNVAWEGDVYSQVRKEVVGEERRGRVRGLGLGPSSLASLSSTQCGEHLDDDHDQCSERMEFLEAKNKRLQDKLIRLEGQQAEVLAEIARLRALVDDSMTDGATPSNSIGT